MNNGDFRDSARKYRKHLFFCAQLFYTHLQLFECVESFRSFQFDPNFSTRKISPCEKTWWLIVTLQHSAKLPNILRGSKYFSPAKNLPLKFRWFIARARSNHIESSFRLQFSLIDHHIYYTHVELMIIVPPAWRQIYLHNIYVYVFPHPRLAYAKCSEIRRHSRGEFCNHCIEIYVCHKICMRNGKSWCIPFKTFKFEARQSRLFFRVHLTLTPKHYL